MPESRLTSLPRRRLDALRAAAADAGSPQLALTLIDGRPIVVWANPAILALLGAEPEDLVGQQLLSRGPARRDLHSVAPHPAGGRLTGPQPPTSSKANSSSSAPSPAPDWSSFVLDALIPDATDTAEPEWESASLRLPDRTLATVQVLVTPAGHEGWIVSLRQVRDEVQAAEEAQRESEHRFRALAEYAPVGIVLSEAGVRLGYVNTKFAEITGADRSTLLGTRWLDAIYPEDLPALLETLDEVMAGSSVETTVRVVSPSDSQRWVQFRLSPVMTPRRASGFIGTVEDITARRAWETQLAYQAGHDALTGLANRRSLMETLSGLLTSRRTRDHKLAVLFCDLDGFKQINDTLGHDAGDRVLIEVAQRLAATARDHDVVARIAGDEFVLIIREIHDLADAEAAAARQLAGLVPAIHVAGKSVRVSASIGLALAEDYDDATSLLRAADRGMYQAKGAGRGIYQTNHSRDDEPSSAADGESA